MSNDRFAVCHAVTARWEGGWSDHPADPGGKTMYGITEAVYHAWLAAGGDNPRPVRQITRTEAEAIYHDNYWLPCGGPTLSAGVDLATYDAAVNSGVSRARKWLMASIGGPDHETVKRLCARRLSFVQGLRTWTVFGRGWANRIADIEAKGVARALASSGMTVAAVKDRLVGEAAAADSTAERQAGGAAGAGIGGAGSVVAEQGGQMPAWMAASVVVACTVAVVAFLLRARVNRARAAAYGAESAITG